MWPLCGATSLFVLHVSDGGGKHQGLPPATSCPAPPPLRASLIAFSSCYQSSSKLSHYLTDCPTAPRPILLSASNDSELALLFCFCFCLISVFPGALWGKKWVYLFLKVAHLRLCWSMGLSVYMSQKGAPVIQCSPKLTHPLERMLPSISPLDSWMLPCSLPSVPPCPHPAQPAETC